MPSVAPAVIVNSIINAISQSGGSAIYTSLTDRIHPRKFFVTHNENNFTLWIYIWTLTHGGRPSLPNEYRIQMTSVSSPLRINTDGYTVLLGYYPDLNMFAGFDLQRHQIFTTGSPSIQINISAIHDALQNGLSFTTKDNEEIAVGIRPDQLLNYIYNAVTFHTSGADNRTFTLMERASRNLEVPNNELEEISSDRQIIISDVRRYSRNANFRRQVLNAYENRCAVTRAQLELVEAAHILPVAEEGSCDHVTNGIALSPTMHRAFDNSLIYLDGNLYIRPNEEKIEQLRSNNQIGGLTQFRTLLNRQIHLPADLNQHPNIDFINVANKLRRIPGF